MDVAENWPTLVPSLGVLGLLFYLVIHFLRQAGADRRDYQTTVLNIRQRHDLESDRLRAEIERLEEELDHMRERLQEARKARWEAEDKVAEYRRVVGDLPNESPGTSP